MGNKPKLSIKDVELARKELEEIEKAFTGVFEVIDCDTGKVILTTNNWWKAEAATWSKEGDLWSKKKLNRKIRKVETKAAKVLYGNK